MSRWILQTGFGLITGVAVRLLLPGHHSIGMIATIALSLAGAIGGGLAAAKFLPLDTVQRAGYALSAIGALAFLLAYGIVA